MISQRVSVFDAFGTLVHITKPTRPYALLRHWMEQDGRDVSGFASFVMTSPVSFLDAAQHFNYTLSNDQLSELNGLLTHELKSIVPYPESQDVLKKHLDRGDILVLCSNLGLPYAKPVLDLLNSVGQVSDLGGSSQIQTAFSFDMGCVKPDLSIYSAIEKELRKSHPALSFYMVGDKFEEDCGSPRALGWSAWHMERNKGKTLWDIPF